MKMTWTSALPLLAVLGLSGCTQRSGAAEAAGTASAPNVAAQVGGASISWEEMDKRAGDRLAAIRQDEYEARKQAIDALVYEKLLAAEAAKRGVTTEALLKQEVDAKIAKSSVADAEVIYEANKARVVGLPKAEVIKDIQRQLDARSAAVREGAFREELVAAGKVDIRLEAPHFSLPFKAATPTVGPADAPVTLVEFSDYQCPFCHQAQATLDEVMKKYEGKVRFVHGEYPLPQHPRAFAASQASRCADEQGKFWDFHRNLLLQTGDYEEKDLLARGQLVGLEADKFKTCLASDRFDAAIDEGKRIGSAAGVNSTPTFFINGRKLTGGRSIEDFTRAIDAELAKSAPKAGK